MEEILTYVRTKRTFVVPPSETGFPGVLSIRKFADGRPDTLVFQGLNVETGEYVDPHDMYENRDVNKVVKTNMYGRMIPPSVTVAKAAAAAGAGGGGAALNSVLDGGVDFGILGHIWRVLGEGDDVWMSPESFGEMYDDLGPVFIHPELLESVGIVPVVSRKKDAKRTTIGKDEIKVRKELGAIFETLYVISSVGRILHIPISILRRAALLR